MTEPKPPALSATELKILHLVATGATNREIAHQRGITEATVKKHLTNIFDKLGTSNRTEALRRAIEQGLVTVETPVGEAPPEGQPEAGHQAAVRLAQELERTRRHSRRAVRSIATAAVAVVVMAAIASYAYVELQSAPATVVAPTPSVSDRTWFPGVNLPSPRTGLALVTDESDGSIFAIGGRGVDGPVSQTLRFPIDGLRWERVADKPTPVESIGSVALRGEFVVPGGCGADGKATKVVEFYDAGADSWRQGSPLPDAVCGYALAEVQGEVYLFGGRSDDSTDEVHDAVLRYDPAADRWSLAGRLPLPRSDLAAAVVGDAIYLLGGRDSSGALQRSHWAYRPFAAESGRWASDGGPVLPEPRAGLTAVASAVKNVYVVGGGWGGKLEDGVIVLRMGGARPEWEPQPDVPGFTPARGAGMTLVEGRLLVLVGGEADTGPLDRQYRWEVVPSTIIFPGPAGLR
jgi:DNA-binding CsgD family transcriptional regulator